MILHTPNNLFLVEHDYQVDDFLKRGMREKGFWIALGPSAVWRLNKEKIDYKIPEDFYSSEELENICLGYHEKIKWLCNKLDGLLSEKCLELKRWGIRPFLFNVFPLTVLFDGFVSRIFQLKSIFKFYPQYTIWIHKSRSYPWGIFDICFSNNETLYGHLLSLNGWDCQINLTKNSHEIVVDKDKNFVSYFRNLLKLVINQSVLTWTSVQYIRKKNFNLFNVFVQRSKGSILVNNGVGEWRYIIPILIKKGYRVLFINDSFFGIDKEKEKIGDNLFWPRDDGEIMSCFEYQGISFFPLVENRLSWLFSKGIKDSEKIMKETVKITKRYNVRALLNITNASFVSHTVNQVAKSLGIPVLNWQHGFVNYYNGISQINEFNDMLTSDVVLSYGDGVSDAYRKYTFKFDTDVISVGNITLDRIQGREKKTPRNNGKRKRILYVTSNYLQNTWYYGFSPPFSDRLFLQDQLCIMNILQEIANKEYDITVKIHPITTHQDPPWIIEFYNKKGIRIVKRESCFIDLLKSHDIVIIDLPTTVLLEALATNKPIFVLMRHWKYSYYDRKILEKRVVCADSVNILMNAVEKHIETGNYPASFCDETFLRAYGNYLGDGKSSERVLKILDDVMNNEKNC